MPKATQPISERNGSQIQGCLTPNSMSPRHSVASMHPGWHLPKLRAGQGKYERNRLGKYLISHHHYCLSQPAVIFPGGAPSVGSGSSFPHCTGASGPLWSLTWHICYYPISSFKYLTGPKILGGAALSSFQAPVVFACSQAEGH